MEREGVDDATGEEAAIGSLPWESDWTADNTGPEVTAPIIRNAHAYGTRVMGENYHDDIDIDKREEGARLEEQQHKATRYDNRNESEEDEPYANYKTNELNLPATTSPTDKPSVKQLMEQMAIIQ